MRTTRRVILVLVVFAAVVFGLTGGALATTATYPDVTLNDWSNGNTPEVWDLTEGDLVLRYTIDMSGIENAGWAIVEVGLREVGAPNIDPNGKGGFLLSKFASAADNPAADLNDYHVLMKHGWSEEYYDLFPDGCSLTGNVPPGTYCNYAFWFDRGPVDEWQAAYWNYKDGLTYNTGGVYDVVITYSALSADTGSMFVTINGEAQGFYVGGYDSAGPPSCAPVGRTFTGDMTQMQFFYGRGSGGGAVVLSDISVDGFRWFDGKATGGTIGRYGDETIRLEFNAMTSKDGAKGIVRWRSDTLGWFVGRVVDYGQNEDGEASIIVETVAADGALAGWEYWNLNVKDSGEGTNASPDMFIAYGYQTQPALDFIGWWAAEVVHGNIQVR